MQVIKVFHLASKEGVINLCKCVPEEFLHGHLWNVQHKVLSRYQASVFHQPSMWLWGPLLAPQVHFRSPSYASTPSFPPLH